MFNWLDKKKEPPHNTVEKKYSSVPRQELIERMNDLIKEIYKYSYQCRKINIFDRYYYFLNYNQKFNVYPLVIAISKKDVGTFKMNSVIGDDDIGIFDVVIPVSDAADHHEEYEHFVKHFEEIKEEFRKQENILGAEYKKKEDKIKNIIELIKSFNKG